MAVAFSVERAEDPDTTNQTNYPIGAAFTPAADTLLLGVNGSVDQTDAAYTLNSLNTSPNVLTWTSIRAASTFTSTQFARLGSFSALVGGSPESVNITAVHSEAVTGHSGWIGEFTGHNPTTPIKSNHNGVNDGTTDPNVSLTSAPDADSLVLGCASCSRNPPAWTPEAGWTEHMDNGHINPAWGLGVYSNTSADQSFTTTGVDVSHCSQIYEIDAAAGGAATQPGWVISSGGWWLLSLLARPILLRSWSSVNGRLVGAWEHPLRDVILAARDGLYVPTTRELCELGLAA